MKTRLPQPYLLPLLGLILAAATALFWINAGQFQTGFLGEDFAYLRYTFANPKPWLWALIFPNEYGQYRPLGHQLYFLLSKAFWGLEPVAFHVVQLSIHIANTILCFLLLRTIARATWNKLSPFSLDFVALFSAFLWSILGSHAKAIFWAAATNNLLYSFFGLLIANLLLHKKRGNWIYGVLFFFAIISKEFALLIPAFGFLVLESATKSFKKRVVLLLPLLMITTFYIGYRIIMSQGMASNFSPALTPEFPLALLTYFTWASHPLEPLPILFWIIFAVISIFHSAARGFFIFPVAIFLLSLWPRHLMPEFLYFSTVGLALAFQAALHLANTQIYLRKFSFIFVLISVAFIVPREYSLARDNQQYLQHRSEIFADIHRDLEKIPGALNKHSPLFWKELNLKLAEEAKHAPWYIDLYWPGRFPCLTDNFRKSFSSLGAKNSVTTLTPSLFQCASPSK